MKKKILAVISTITGIAVGITICVKWIVKPTFNELKRARELAAKHLDLYLLMNEWTKVKQEGKKLSTFFSQNGYKRIAIYGMNYVGQTLVRELKGADVEVVAGIDKAVAGIIEGIDMYTPEDFPKDVDVIVVTPITYFDDISNMLKQKVKCPVVSIEDIVYEIK